MAYLTEEQLNKMKFKSLGKNILISQFASIYNCEEIEIGDNSRIDDFCVVSGRITIGRNVYIGPQCLVAGGEKGIIFEDFSTLAYQVQVFSQSDDYSGTSMTNPTVPGEYKREIKREIRVERHSIVGAGSVIMPGVTLSEGTSVGASSLVTKSTESWSIYVGSPARKVSPRKRDLLKLERLYLEAE